MHSAHVLFLLTHQPACARCSFTTHSSSLSYACCLSFYFGWISNSALDSIICQCREWRTALCRLLLKPYPITLAPSCPCFLLLSPPLLPSVQFAGPGWLFLLKRDSPKHPYMSILLFSAGCFYSCLSTVAEADQCLAMSDRSAKAAAGQHMQGGGERGYTPASFVIENMWRRERNGRGTGM